MTQHTTLRTTAVRRGILQRIAGYQASPSSPSEQAIRSISEFRSTPRW